MADGLNHEDEIHEVNEKEPENSKFIRGIDTLQVENIVATRISKGNKRQYLVSFKSWLLEEFLEDYEDLIQEFWRSNEIANGQTEQNGLGNYSDDEIVYSSPTSLKNNTEKTNVLETTSHQDECITNGCHHTDGDSNGEQHNEKCEAEDVNNDEDVSNESMQSNSQISESESNSKDNLLSVDNSESLLCKKRKLKSLDDIVRKITKTNDASGLENGVDLSDRLHNLDQTLKENGNGEVSESTVQVVIKQESNGVEPQQNGSNSTFGSNRDTNGGNVYWSSGKAYQKTIKVSGNCSNGARDEQIDVMAQYEQSTKTRRRYQKCRFCSTLYSDPVLLERHENSHFEYSGKHSSFTGLQHREPPPPLLSVAREDTFQYPSYTNRNGYDCPSPSRSPILHYPYSTSNNPSDESSLVRKPLRNLLTKMYESEKRNQGDENFQDLKTEEEDVNVSSDSQPQVESCPSPEYNKGLLKMAKLPDHRAIKDEKHLMNETSFPCSICNECFDMKDRLKQHIDIVHLERGGNYKCGECNERFVGKTAYDAHCLTHTCDSFVCDICQKIFKCQASYENHLRSHSQYKQQYDQHPHQQQQQRHHEQSLCCHFCERMFMSRVELRHHLLVHASETPSFQCHVCGKAFERSDILNHHMKDSHRENGDTDSRQHSPVYNDERIHQPSTDVHVSPRVMENSPSRSSCASHDSSEQQRYEPIKIRNNDHSLSICHKESRSYDVLITSNSPTIPHHHPSRSAYPHHQHYYRQQLQQQQHNEGIMPSPSSSQQRCNKISPSGVCDRGRIQMTDRQHSYSPINTNPVKILPRPTSTTQRQAPITFECLKCGERFTSPSLYDIHVQSHKEVFECSKCHKSFTSRSQFDLHVQSHENSKSHKCPYCNRSFSMKGNLRRHIRIHTNEAPYECPICFQRFRRSDGLKGHIKRHQILGESAPSDLLPSQAS